MANSNIATDWSKFDFSDEGIDRFVGSKSTGSQTDWTKFDFSDEGISAFEALTSPEPKQGFIGETLDMLGEVGLETAKAIPSVLGATLGSIALLPGAGIRAAIELIPTMSTDPDEPWWKGKAGSLSKAGEVFEEIMSVPGKLITTEEQAKAVENIGYVMKPIEMSGEGWRLIGEKVNSGLKYLGFADTFIEPLFATYGEAAAVLAIPGVIKKLAKTPVKQRGLRVQDLLDEVKANPNMTEGEILRRAGVGSELWEAKRAELRKTEAPRVRPIIKTESPKGSVPKAEPAKTMPIDKIPDYEFTSKKGNHYTKVGDSWYNNKGKLTINKYVVAAAEKGKSLYIDIKEAVEPVVEEAEPLIEVKEKEEVPGLKKEERVPEVRKKIIPTNVYRVVPKGGEFKSNIGEGNWYFPEEYEAIDFGDALYTGGYDLYKVEVKGNIDKYRLVNLPDVHEAKKLGPRDEANELYIPDDEIISKKIERAEEPVVEPITKPLTLQETKDLGLPEELEGLTTEQVKNFLEEKDIFEGLGEPDRDVLQSSFRELDPEVTKQRMQTLPDYDRIDTSEALVKKLTAEINAGMDDPKVDTSAARQLVSQLAAQLGEWTAGEGPLPGGIFETMSMAELGQAAEVFRQMDKWAGGGVRERVEPSETLYSLGGAITEAARQLFNKLTFRKSKLQPVPPKPFIKELAREGVRERRSTLDLATYETNLFLNSLERKTTPIQREALTFMLEKTGVPDVPGTFSRPDIKKSLEKDNKYLKPIAAEIKRYLDSSWEDIKKYLPDLTVKQVENYITHLWDIPKHKRAEAANWFSTHARFLEPRFIDTYKAGIERGYKPKTLDVAEIIKVRDSAINRAIANAQYIDALLKLKADGIHLIQRSIESPLDYVEVDYPMLTRRIPLPKGKAKQRKEFVKESRVRVHPDLVRPLKVIFEERFDHPVISAYEAINGVMKKSILSLSLFHHGALGETGLILIGPVGTAKIYFDPVKIYKAMVRGEFEIFNKIEIARDSIVHGVQYGATADYPVANIQRWLNDLARQAEGLPMANRLTKFAADFNTVWDRALWNYLHDTLKLYAYEALVAKLDPKLDPFQTTMAKREIAQFDNDTFGGQQWDLLMITPKEVQMMTWSLLSMDWTFSTTRQALALTGIGKVHKETAGLRRKMAWKFWGRAGLYFGIGMNALNAFFREWDMKENPQFYEDGKEDWDYFDKTMFGNTPGKKTQLLAGRYDDGSERYLKWGKQLWDFFELIINPPKKIGGKAAPLPQLMSSIFTGHSLSGFRNDDTYKKKGLEKTLGILKTVAKAFIPLSIKKAMRDDVEFKVTDIVMRSTKGMTRYTAIDYFKQAIVDYIEQDIVDRDERMIEETYRAALRNNLPAFTLFNSALSWIGAEASAELRESVDSIEDVRAKMSVSESPRERMRYGKILGRLEREKADIEQGVKLLGAALEKARALDMSEEIVTSPRLGVVGSRIRSPRL